MVAGIILAAGQSRRMGEPKQLLLLKGKPMVRHVAEQACRADLEEVIVVTGAYRDEVREVLAGLPLKLLHNQSWESGQSSSVKAGLGGLGGQIGAVSFLLADQPFVNTALINSLVRTFRGTGASIIVPGRQDRCGNPVLFDLARWRNELFQLSGDEGARRILARHRSEIRYLETSDETAFMDVDTPEDYQRIKELWE
jgi:molybdenum cofactor cytidylyltransferase